MSYSRADIPRSDDRASRWCLFLGILIWFADLNTVYALPSLACEWGWFNFTLAGISGLTIVEALISLVAIALMLYMIYLPWRIWRRLQIEKPESNPHLLRDTESHRRTLMPFVTMLVNGFFLLFIIATFVPMLALNVCALG